MKKILFLSLLLISTLVHSVDWILVNTNKNGDRFFIETSSIQTVKAYKRAWTKIEIKEVTDNIFSQRGYIEFDCIEKKLRFLSLDSFKQPNLVDLLKSNNQVSEWIFVPPGSSFATVMSFVCKSK